MPTTLYIAASLDGFIAGPNGEIDFLDAVNDPSGKEDYGYKAFLDSVDVVVMGRKTWDLCRTFGGWQYPGKESWILTRQAGLAPMADERFAPFDVEQWRALSGERHVWLIGGGEMVKLFMEHGLIDALILSTVPVVLGRGLPLFPTDTARTTWRLTSSVAFPSGLVQSSYVPTRAAPVAGRAPVAERAPVAGRALVAG